MPYPPKECQKQSSMLFSQYYKENISKLWKASFVNHPHILWTSENRKRMKQEKHQKLKQNTRPRRKTSTKRRSKILCVEKEKLCYKSTALIIRTLNSQCGRHYHQTVICSALQILHILKLDFEFRKSIIQGGFFDCSALKND